MAKFNDLAVELQEAIWQLVLPQAHGVHWIEVEGIPREPDFIRLGIRMTDWHQFDRIPETWDAAHDAQGGHPEFYESVKAKENDTGPFFRRLLTTVPAVLGRSGPDDDDGATPQNDSKQLPYDRADEIAYTHRCRQLSTYTQISTLLSTCRLSRLIAQQHIHDESDCSWPLYRSMGPLYRPRPMDVWETQYGGDKAPTGVISHADDAELLAPSIHALDLVVFRLHDSQGRATPLLQHAAWQYGGKGRRDAFFGCFDRIGIEWHPSWGTVGGRGELRPGNVHAIVRLMETAHWPWLYWLVDGVPRPNWSRDYPAVVREIFAEQMARKKTKVLGHLKDHWGRSDQERAEMLADHHLGQEFEANGRRYYIVFVVSALYGREERERLRAAGLGVRGPFPGSADLWPEAVREPVRLAHDLMSARNMGAGMPSYILSWEPI